jgi:hypothetical protein
MGATIMEKPMGTKRKLRVLFIGMGASGVNFAYQLQRKTENIDLVVYEKNASSTTTFTRCDHALTMTRVTSEALGMRIVIQAALATSRASLTNSPGTRRPTGHNTTPDPTRFDVTYRMFQTDTISNVLSGLAMR